MFNWKCHRPVLAAAKLSAHKPGGVSKREPSRWLQLLIYARFPRWDWERINRDGRIISRGDEDRIQISAGGPRLPRACFLALSFMFKADWQWNSDAATWSIWLLIRGPTSQKAQWQPPPSSLPGATTPHPDDTTVRLQLGPHPNPWFTFRVIILSTCADGAWRAVQCKHADLYFVLVESFDDTFSVSSKEREWGGRGVVDMKWTHSQCGTLFSFMIEIYAHWLLVFHQLKVRHESHATLIWLNIRNSQKTVYFNPILSNLS